MSSPIDKRTLEHLAKLARIELDAKEEEKLLHDLRNILDHFKELEELDTTNVAPIAGGSDVQNVFREDTERESSMKGKGVETFPEHKDGFLRVPQVFSGE